MSEHAPTTAAITASSIVLLVSNISKTSEFYRNLGFRYEEIGGHVHVSRGNLTMILHPAVKQEDVRPASTVEGGLYFDAFAYTDAVDLLVDEFRTKGVKIVRGPHYSEHWSEFTMLDADGYRIAFGGGTSKRMDQSRA